MDSHFSKPNIDRKFIRNIVEQFAEGISKNNKQFEKSSFGDLVKPFIGVIIKALQLNPSTVSVQITNAPSIYILIVMRQYNLHFDLHFSEETGKFEEAVVNIFLNKVQKLNIFGSIEEISCEIQAFFNNNEQNTQSNYAISNQPYS
jgi:hypothetical protein